MPWMATNWGGLADMLRSELNVVTPAHISGATSAGSIPSGMATTASVRSVTYSAYPPWRETPEYQVKHDEDLM